MPGESEVWLWHERSTKTCSCVDKLIRLASSGRSLNAELFWRNAIGQGNFSRAKKPLEDRVLVVAPHLINQFRMSLFVA